MRGPWLVLMLFPFLGASALAQGGVQPLDQSLKEALSEQAAAQAQTAKLEQAASRARTAAERLHAEQAAAVQGIEAAEARISAANARLGLISAYVAAHQQQLASQQQPVSSLLAGLATMARRPPLLVIAQQGGPDELVRVRLLLQTTLPVIRSRTRGISAELANGEKLRREAIAARAELTGSREGLIASQRRFAALERKAMQQALSSGGRALGTGDVAMAAGEAAERLRSEQASNQSIRAVAAQIANEEPAPSSPFPAPVQRPRLPFPYQLPAVGVVTEGLASVNESGVRSRGITLATRRGAEVTAPADGIIRFSGPYRDYDGVLIIEHAGGWMSLLVNVATTLHPGDKVTRGEKVGRAIGPLQVELSQNGRRISPALIAGSSQNLSNDSKGS